MIKWSTWTSDWFYVYKVQSVLIVRENCDKYFVLHYQLENGTTKTIELADQQQNWNIWEHPV